MSDKMSAKPWAKNCCTKGAMRIIQQTIWRKMLLFGVRPCKFGWGMVALPAGGGITAWKISWRSKWIKLLKYLNTVVATASGCNVAFGDICNWEMKSRKAMLKIQYRNSVFVHEHRKYFRIEKMVWELGVGEREAKTILKCGNWTFTLWWYGNVFGLAANTNFWKTKLRWLDFYLFSFRKYDCTSLENSLVP